MKNVPLTPRNIFTFILIFAITIGFTLLFVHFSKTIKDTPVEETIEMKYSKKGLYLFPRYEIMVSNSERPSTVSKEQFESMEVGDQVSGYKKNAETFVTNKDIQFEITLGIVLLLFLYLVMFAVVCSLIVNAKFINNNNKRQKIISKIRKGSIYGFLSIYIVVGMVFVVLIATNAYHKVSSWNQIETDGTVLGGDYNETRSQRGAAYTTYELFILYEDIEGVNHITKKAISKNTYSQYDVEETIPIAYRNNNVYDTFIPTRDSNEIWPVFINLFTFFIAFYLISLFFIIKAWRKRKLQSTLTAHTDEEEIEKKTYEMNTEELDSKPSNKDTIKPPLKDRDVRDIVATWKHNFNLNQEEQAVQQHTRVWEKRILWFLAALAFIAGGVIFPFNPVDDNGKLFMTYPILFILALTFLIPVCFTFWRSHTRWYLPLLYFIVSIGISTSVFLLISAITNTPVQLTRVIQFYLLVTIVGWIPLFVVCKVTRGLMKLIRKE